MAINMAINAYSSREELTELIEAARLGDPSAMELLMRASRAALSECADRMLPATVQARLDPSDVIQDVLLEANNDFSRFQGKSSMEWKTWLRKVLANNVVECLRRHIHAEKRSVRREQSVDRRNDGGLLIDQATPSERVAREELVRWLAVFQPQLPPESQTVLKLRYWEGNSLSEIASAMDLSKSAAARLLRTSLLLLRQFVSKRIEPDDLS